MRPVHSRRRHAPGKHARPFACAVLVSLISCNRQDSQYSAPEPAEPPGQEIPHFIPPKDRRMPAGAGGKTDASSAEKPPHPSQMPAAASSFPARGCPENMARVKRFCIDRFEIHLVGAGGFVHPYSQRPPYGMEGLSARSSPGVFPQGYLSQEMSEKACGAAGKRLCTLDEWQAACTGGGSRRYPYGNEAAPGMCNVNKREPHILDKHFPDTPHMRRTGKHFNDPALLLDPDYLVKTNQMTGCATPEGIHDMDGNLSEWVGDSAQKAGVKHGTFAGDAFSGFGNDGCGRRTAAHAANYHDYSMGTRCCKDAR